MTYNVFGGTLNPAQSNLCAHSTHHLNSGSFTLADFAQYTLVTDGQRCRGLWWMEEADGGWLTTTIDVGGWMFLPVPAHPGCPGQNPERETERTWLSTCSDRPLTLYLAQQLLCLKTAILHL